MIDEMGKMELFSRKFAEKVEYLIKSSEGQDIEVA